MGDGNREKELLKTIDELYKQIGQLKVEKERIQMVEKESSLSIRTRCSLLSVPRRTHYYKALEESKLNKEVMEW